MSNLSRGSSFRNRQTSRRFAGSTTTKGSMASAFLSLILGPSWDSKKAMMSAATMQIPPSPVMSAAIHGGPGSQNPQESLRSSWGFAEYLCLARRRFFLRHLRIGNLLLERLGRVGVIRLRRQLDVGGSRADRQVACLALGQVTHAAHFVLHALPDQGPGN